MAKLCDPDIDMIFLLGSSTPEPSIRSILCAYYNEGGATIPESEELARLYIEEQDKICQASIASKSQHS